MNCSQMKNMVILKNLPSNIVEEAIIVLKEKTKVKNIEYSNIKNKNKNDKINENDYIIREAEMLVYKYINEIEGKKEKNATLFKKKYKRSRIINIILALVICLELIIL